MTRHCNFLVLLLYLTGAGDRRLLRERVLSGQTRVRSGAEPPAASAQRNQGGIDPPCEAGAI